MKRWLLYLWRLSRFVGVAWAEENIIPASITPASCGRGR